MTHLNDEYSVRLITKLESLNLRSRTKIDLDEIKKAMIFAKEYHGEQKRDSGEPYYSHPAAVCELVADCRFKTDVLVASLLHDVVEDTIATVEIVQKEFGWRVAQMVEGLTRIKLGKKVSSEEILRILYEHEDKEAMTVKICDRIHNMQTIGAKSEEKQRITIKETLRSYTLLAIYLDISGIERQIYQLCDYRRNISIVKLAYNDKFSVFTSNLLK